MRPREDWSKTLARQSAEEAHRQGPGFRQAESVASRNDRSRRASWRGDLTSASAWRTATTAAPRPDLCRRQSGCALPWLRRLTGVGVGVAGVGSLRVSQPTLPLLGELSGTRGFTRQRDAALRLVATDRARARPPGRAAREAQPSSRPHRRSGSQVVRSRNGSMARPGRS